MSTNQGKLKHAASVVTSRLKEDPTSLVKFSAVMSSIGISDTSNFRRSIRQHPDFMDVMEEEGIIEWGHGVRLTGFVNAFHAYGF